jgi:hypothetical protein
MGASSMATASRIVGCDYLSFRFHFHFHGLFLSSFIKFKRPVSIFLAFLYGVLLVSSHRSIFTRNSRTTSLLINSTRIFKSLINIGIFLIYQFQDLLSTVVGQFQLDMLREFFLRIMLRKKSKNFEMKTV